MSLPDLARLVMPGAAGPDVIGIGMQKAGTGWLYDQLQLHPECWMPPVKELHYFDRPFPGEAILELADLARHEPERLASQRRRKGWRPLDERDAAFVAAAEECACREPDLPTYEALFRFKGSLLSGDI